MKRVVPIVASLLTFVGGGGVESAVAGPWPATIRAAYEVNFNGINVGTFEFEAQTEDESYSLTGNAHLTLLLGAFTWIGETRAFGMLADQVPRPAVFSFDFKANNKTGSTKVDFGEDSVLSVKHNPLPTPKSDVVPLRDQHLRGVLDPLSAVMVVSNYSKADPCERRLPIFDGKERFDLVMTYKGEVKVSEQQPSGQPAIAHVCRVKYRPIAGHKADATTDAIEVSLRPVPSANILVPYQITIPTMLGYATIVSKRVEIDSPGRPQIALLH
jgi:hypothetical protein